MNPSKQNKRMCRRIIATSLATVLIIGSLAACSSDNGREDDGRPIVYTSLYILYDFATKIGGEHIAIDYVIPADGGAHDWEPSPSDIAILEEADAFIYNGAGLEHWVDDVLNTLENENLIVLNTSDKVELIDGDSHSHDHDHDEEDEDSSTGHDEDETHEDEHSHDVDPHIWLSPVNVKLQMEAIKDLFIELDPEHADTYEQNYETQAVALDELDREFMEGLENLRSRELVVSHEAFAYMADRYHLHQQGVEGLTPHSEPDASRMAEIIDFIKAEGIEVVFFEELEGTQVADTIAAETNIKTASLSPLEKYTAEQIAAGEDYFSKMRRNLATLIEYLG